MTGASLARRWAENVNIVANIIVNEMSTIQILRNCSGIANAINDGKVRSTKSRHRRRLKTREKNNLIILSTYRIFFYSFLFFSIVTISCSLHIHSQCILTFYIQKRETSEDFVWPLDELHWEWRGQKWQALHRTHSRFHRTRILHEVLDVKHPSGSWKRERERQWLQNWVNQAILDNWRDR